MKSDSNGKRRETLGSRIGFILMAAGCSIGLGNVWRFPFVTGANGGAIFVLIYLLFLVMLAVPIMTMEFAMGRASRLSIGRHFRELEPRGARWHLFQPIGVLGNVLLMSFYTVVTGWIFFYFWSYISGTMGTLSGPEEVGAFFGSMLGSPELLAGWTIAVVLCGGAVCGIGLRSGAERVTKVMMSCLLVIMVALAVHSCTLPNASEGLRFFLMPDIDKFIESGPMNVIYVALGQAFFTLSVGIGSMAIFGSYIDRNRSLMGEGLIIAGLDTLVAVCSGLIIFPACFAHGVEPGAGPGLIFVSLPNMFAGLAAPRLWGSLFFLFMSFAALSTVVAVFENIIASMMDIFGWSRGRASLATTLMMAVLSMPCALGFNLWSNFHPLGGDSVVLDLEDFILSNNLLPIGALIYAMFCCSRYGWGWDAFIAEADAGEGIKFPKRLRLFMTYVVPIIMLIVFVMGYYDKFFK